MKKNPHIKHYHIEMSRTEDGVWEWQVVPYAPIGSSPAPVFFGRHKAGSVAARKAQQALMKVPEYKIELGDYSYSTEEPGT